MTSTKTERSTGRIVEALSRLLDEFKYQISIGNVPPGRIEVEMAESALAELRSAPPAPAAEPVAWRSRHRHVNLGRWGLSTVGPSEETERLGWEYQPLYTAPPPVEASSDYVRMPQTEDEAAAMALIGHSWLEQNAPHRLKASQQQSADAGSGEKAEDEGWGLRLVQNLRAELSRLTADLSAAKAEAEALRMRDEQWWQIVSSIGQQVGALASSFPDANDHVVKKARTLKAEAERLSALCDLSYATGITAGWNCETAEERDALIERTRRPALQHLRENRNEGEKP